MCHLLSATYMRFTIVDPVRSRVRHKIRLFIRVRIRARFFVNLTSPHTRFLKTKDPIDLPLHSFLPQRYHAKLQLHHNS